MQDQTPPNGTTKLIDGEQHLFYDGYWIKAYPPPANSLAAKKKLIEALTRRLFNHVEHGINIPGKRLDEARRAYESETDPERGRVKGAMLAGALFNRAADIFTKLVELQEMGVKIDADNALMRECGRCLQEALKLGKLVLHRSGEEGIDELWGEPFRAFSIPVEDFYESRYLKIAQTMRDIDRVTHSLVETFTGNRLFEGVIGLLHNFAAHARHKCEILRTDDEIFDVWAAFVVASERLAAYSPRLQPDDGEAVIRLAADGQRLLQAGRELASNITRARVPMPKSTREFLEQCTHYAATASHVLSQHPAA